MGLIKKVRQIGNSLALPVPGEIFDFLNLDIKNIKYKLCQDETGGVYVLILKKDVFAIDEKKFQKLGKTSAIIIPRALCIMWNIGLSAEQKREIEISFDASPLKWRLEPV